MTYVQLLDVCDKQEYYLRQFKERIVELESAIGATLYGDILPDTCGTRDDNSMFRNFDNPEVLRKHMANLVKVLEQGDI